MTTLKELKKAYPEHITTSGCVYHIEGMGEYKQIKNKWTGVHELFYKEWDDTEGDSYWTYANFARLASLCKAVFG